MDIYRRPNRPDRRKAASERLGVSRTPVREAIALEQQGFVKRCPGGIIVPRRPREVIEMIQAWAALESMAVRPSASGQVTTSLACAAFSASLRGHKLV